MMRYIPPNKRQRRQQARRFATELGVILAACAILAGLLIGGMIYG